MKKSILLRVAMVLLCSILLLTGCKKGNRDYQFQLQLGNACLSAGKYEEAIEAFDGAIAMEPDQPDGYAGRAEAHMASGNEEKARDDVNWVIRYYPDYVWPPYPYVKPVVDEFKTEDITPTESDDTAPTEPDSTDPTEPEANKLLSTASTFDSSGDMKTHTAFSYNAAGQIIEYYNEEWATYDGIRDHMTGSTVNQYDTQGNLLSSNSYRSHGGSDSKIHTYEAGLRTQTAYYVNEELSERTSYQYSPDGQLLSSETTSEYDGEVYLRLYQYDSNGLLIQEAREMDGLTDTITYEYDQQNRLLREEHSDKSVSYDYTQKPFVVITTVTPYGDIYNAWQYMGYTVFDFYPNEVHCEFDAEGYVTAIYSNDPEGASLMAQLRYEDPSSKPTVEEMAATIEALYNAGADSNYGTYVVFPEETLETADGWEFVVRFVSTAENAQANVLAGIVYVNWNYDATDENGNFMINLQDSFM